MSARCAITCVGVGHWYPKGVARLDQSLAQVGYTGARLLWTQAYPPGASSHAEIPYAFKVHAVEAARQQLYDSILWLDASCWAIKSLDPIWAHLEEHGYLIFPAGHWLGAWSTDRSIAALGLSRESSMYIPLVVGGCFGVRLSHPIGREFHERLLRLATPEVYCGDWKNDRQQCSSSPLVFGHRHDQVAMGYLASVMGLKFTLPPKFFSYDTPRPDPEALILARGM